MQSFLCKLYHDHGWPAAALQTPCRLLAGMPDSSVLVSSQSLLLSISPLKINSQLEFLWVTPRQRLNSSFSHEEWKAGKAEL